VAIADNSLRIIQIDKLGDLFTKRELKTRYTPTKMLIAPESNYLVVLEKDHNQESISKLNAMKKKVS
jgi:splicing factor 3B subunit 3